MDIRLQILDHREKRIKIIKEIIDREKKLVITIKANICGNEKNIKETNIILKYFTSLILKTFDIKKIEKVKSIDGNYYIIVIKEKSTIEVKKKLIILENYAVGRLIDLDLYENGVKSISRRDIGEEKRTCIICNSDYTKCSREKAHTVEEVLDKSKSVINNFLINNVKNIAKNALTDEVYAHPKFGLVTPHSNGAHTNMDITTFTTSIEAIEKYLLEYAQEGFNIDGNTFKKLRKIGIEAEKKMLSATNNINTHKGLIFILGILLPSIVHNVLIGKTFLEISSTVKKLSENILEDFKYIDEKKFLTYGEKAYKNYGLKGVRGEVHNGLTIAFECTEKFYNYKGNKNNLVVNILLFVMEQLDDTVILHRNDIEVLQYVKSVAKEINKLGAIDTKEGIRSINYYTDKFIDLKISSGGCADIVVVVLILIEVKKTFYRSEEYEL